MVLVTKCPKCGKKINCASLLGKLSQKKRFKSEKEKLEYFSKLGKLGAKKRWGKKSIKKNL